MSYIVHWSNTHSATLYTLWADTIIPFGCENRLCKTVGCCITGRYSAQPHMGNGPLFTAYEPGYSCADDAFTDYLYWAVATALQCADLGIEGMYHHEIAAVLDLADRYYRKQFADGYYELELGDTSMSDDQLRIAWQKIQEGL